MTATGPRRPEPAELPVLGQELRSPAGPPGSKLSSRYRERQQKEASGSDDQMPQPLSPLTRRHRVWKAGKVGTAGGPPPRARERRSVGSAHQRAGEPSCRGVRRGREGRKAWASAMIPPRN